LCSLVYHLYIFPWFLLLACRAYDMFAYLVPC
jgi:hypothetical protein